MMPLNRKEERKKEIFKAIREGPVFEHVSYNATAGCGEQTKHKWSTVQRCKEIEIYLFYLQHK